MIEEHPKPQEIDLSNVRYIISDWDGTLVDSMPAYTAAYSRLMEEKFGIDVNKSREYYLSTAGTVLTNQIKDGAKNFAGQQVEDTLELENLFWSYQIGSSTPQVIEGAQETLRELKERGYTIVVWSGTRSDVLADALERTKLEEYISFSIGNEPGSSTKVKGRGLIDEIAASLKIPLDSLLNQSVVIGDGIGDIRAGKEINCPTIAILKTQPREKLQEAGADFIIQKISDLPALLYK